VWPGVEGLRKFGDDVRAVCSLKAADHISLTFSCKAPRTGALDAVPLSLRYATLASHLALRQRHCLPIDTLSMNCLSDITVIEVTLLI